MEWTRRGKPFENSWGRQLWILDSLIERFVCTHIKVEKLISTLLNTTLTEFLFMYFVWCVFFFFVLMHEQNTPGRALFLWGFYFFHSAARARFMYNVGGMLKSTTFRKNAKWHQAFLIYLFFLTCKTNQVTDLGAGKKKNQHGGHSAASEHGRWSGM